jgi:hypothetical protein
MTKRIPRPDKDWARALVAVRQWMVPHQPDHALRPCRRQARGSASTSAAFEQFAVAIQQAFRPGSEVLVGADALDLSLQGLDDLPRRPMKSVGAGRLHNDGLPD